MSELLLAAEGIRQLHSRYVDAVWRKDWDAFEDCWTEDAQWKIAGNVFNGRAEIVDFLHRSMANFHRVIMTFRNPIIDKVENGTAQCRTYCSEQNGFKNGRPGQTVGIYFERLRACDDGRWRRSFALFQLWYMGPPDMTGSYFEQPDYGAPPAFPPDDAVAINYSKIQQ
jgi:ketosteroid isomerase-like protein